MPWQPPPPRPNCSRLKEPWPHRWLRTADRDGESLLGASDIQSLADLGTAYAVIKEIRPMPFSRDMFLQLVFAIDQIAGQDVFLFDLEHRQGQQ